MALSCCCFLSSGILNNEVILATDGGFKLEYKCHFYLLLIFNSVSGHFVYVIIIYPFLIVGDFASLEWRPFGETYLGFFIFISAKENVPSHPTALLAWSSSSCGISGVSSALGCSCSKYAFPFSLLFYLILVFFFFVLATYLLGETGSATGDSSMLGSSKGICVYKASVKPSILFSFSLLSNKFILF